MPILFTSKNLSNFFYILSLLVIMQLVLSRFYWATSLKWCLYPWHRAIQGHSEELGRKKHFAFWQTQDFLNENKKFIFLRLQEVSLVTLFRQLWTGGRAQLIKLVLDRPQPAEVRVGWKRRFHTLRLTQSIIWSIFSIVHSAIWCWKRSCCEKVFSFHFPLPHMLLKCLNCKCFA